MMQENCLQLIENYQKLIEYKNIFSFSSKKLDKDDVKELKKKNTEIKSIIREINKILKLVVVRECEELLNLVNDRATISIANSAIAFMYYKDLNDEIKADEKMFNPVLEVVKLEATKSMDPVTPVDPFAISMVGNVKHKIGDKEYYKHFDIALDIARDHLESVVDHCTIQELMKNRPEFFYSMVDTCKMLVDCDYKIDEMINFNKSVDFFFYPDICVKVYLHIFKKLFNNVKKSDDVMDGKIFDLLKNIFANISLNYEDDFLGIMIFIRNKLFELGSKKDFYNIMKPINAITGGAGTKTYSDAIEVEQLCIDVVENNELEYYGYAKSVANKIENKKQKTQAFFIISWYEFHFPGGDKNKQYASTLNKAISVATGMKQEDKYHYLTYIFENQLCMGDFKKSVNIINAIPYDFRRVDCLCTLAKYNFKENDEDFNKVILLINKEISKMKDASDINFSNYLLVKLYIDIGKFKKAHNIINSMPEAVSGKKDLRASVICDYIRSRANI